MACSWSSGVLVGLPGNSSSYPSLQLHTPSRSHQNKGPPFSANSDSIHSGSGRRRRRRSCSTRSAFKSPSIRFSVRASSSSEEGMATMEIEKLGIKIERNPPESKLTQLGVRSWPKWGCPPSNFPWTYSAKETCYLLEGKVKVTPDGANEAVEIGAGDLVVFPKGMSCTWDISVAVDKHYKFD